jgi:hypothetical protein
MTPGIKEKLIMHSIYPKRKSAIELSSIHYLLFYACLIELSEKKIFQINDNRVWCAETETGDPVLDMAISMLVPLSGKKTFRLQLLVSQKASAIFKKQIGMMLENNYLEKEDIVFISWRVGTRYRVRKYDTLKPGITKLERALVYGRKADRETWLLALLAGEGNLFRNIFTGREFREKAKKWHGEFRQSEKYKEEVAISALLKSFGSLQKTKKAVGAIARS